MSTATVSDAFPAVNASAVEETAEIPTLSAAGTPARVRARDTSLHTVIRNFLTGVANDIRDAWWIPQSLPTMRQAWGERFPNRGRVPGGSEVLYKLWTAYAHTVGLIVPAVALGAIGLLTPIVWVARHPARMGLFVTAVGVIIGAIASK